MEIFSMTYYINQFFVVIESHYMTNADRRKLIAVGNWFHSRNDAEEMAEKMREMLSNPINEHY